MYEIKPLEWDAHDDAKTPLGEYRAYADTWALVDDGWCGEYAPCKSLDAAKAACEADWRARIAACLVPVESGWKWISTAPLDGEVVMVWNGIAMRLAFYREGWGWATVPSMFTIKPTHWQPLPAPPEVSK